MNHHPVNAASADGDQTLRRSAAPRREPQASCKAGCAKRTDNCKDPNLGRQTKHASSQARWSDISTWVHRLCRPLSPGFCWSRSCAYRPGCWPRPWLRLLCVALAAEARSREAWVDLGLRRSRSRSFRASAEPRHEKSIKPTTSRRVGADFRPAAATLVIVHQHKNPHFRVFKSGASVAVPMSVIGQSKVCWNPMPPGGAFGNGGG